MGRIDSQGNIEGEKRKGATGTFWFFLVVFILATVGLAIGLVFTLNESDYYQRRYYSVDNERQSILRQGDELRSTISALESEVNSLKNDNARLSSREPTYVVRQSSNTQAYIVASDKAYFHYWAGGYHATRYSYNAGTTVSVYMTTDGYALTQFGWLRMQDIKPQ